MSKTKRKIIAVVTALANSYAEREILNGIIDENRKNGYMTVVFTIIYNTVQKNNDIMYEHKIYDFLRSEDISAVVLLNESFVEENTKNKVADILSECKVHIVGIGGNIPEFDRLGYTSLNTDDRADVEELTSHLIKKHGFTDIAFLTGPKESEISDIRVEGFVIAMNKHNIKPDMSKVYYGDFWLASGRELADRYISGELPYPQAVICANDVMAYGMLERFAESGVRIPEQLTVVSYEYSDMGVYYTPRLTSFKRDRLALGRAAAEHIHCLLSCKEPPRFTAPHGKLMTGRTCTCNDPVDNSSAELKNALKFKTNNDLSLFSPMEQKLTFCHDMKEFIAVLEEFNWLVRDKSNIFLSLFSDWYDTSSPHSEIIQSRSILPLTESREFEIGRYDLHTYFEKVPDAEVCYLSPVFSGQNLFGYIALLYDHTDTYEEVYRSWLKSVSIGLEFLRLKNDIKYLISCQNISEYKDSLTGMYNLNGMKNIYRSLKRQNDKKTYLILLELNLFPHQLDTEEINRKAEAYLGVAEILSGFCGSNDYSGRVSEDIFCCLVQRSSDPALLSDCLESMLMQERHYMEYAGADTFVSAVVPCDEGSFETLLKSGEQSLAMKHISLTEKRRRKNYTNYIKVRNYIYTCPEETFRNDDDILSAYNTDHFRRQYKACFGISFHQDCITARLARAKYYLVSSSLSIGEIAELCGYMDEKYFQRQFSKITGRTALQYRSSIYG